MGNVFWCVVAGQHSYSILTQYPSAPSFMYWEHTAPIQLLHTAQRPSSLGRIYSLSSCLDTAFHEEVTRDLWTWIWGISGRQWRTGEPGVLPSMGSPRVGHDLATEQLLSLFGSQLSCDCRISRWFIWGRLSSRNLFLATWCVQLVSNRFTTWSCRGVPRRFWPETVIKLLKGHKLFLENVVIHHKSAFPIFLELH